MNWTESFAQDLRYGTRQLKQSPGFTLVAVLSLALGIGANSAIFQLIDAVRLRTLPVQNPEELVTIDFPDGSQRSGWFSERSEKPSGFRWGPALGQSLLFLSAEHATRFAFDPPSRTAFSGKFWKEYVASLREVNQWGDGNPNFINYLGHPMQGSVAGFIQIQNDPSGRSLPFSWSKPYWNSRLKALAWSAAYSTYFEIGFPFSESAMGNLGVDKNRQTQQGIVDLVITPTVGLGWLVSEDLIDSYVVDRFERSHPGKIGQALIRSALNPTRSFSNLMRFKPPWHRDGRHLGARRSDVLKTAMRLDGEKKKN